MIGKARAMKGEERNRKKMKRYGRSNKVKKGEGMRRNEIEVKVWVKKDKKGEGHR